MVRQFYALPLPTGIVFTAPISPGSNGRQVGAMHTAPLAMADPSSSEGPKPPGASCLMGLCILPTQGLVRGL